MAFLSSTPATTHYAIPLRELKVARPESIMFLAPAYRTVTHLEYPKMKGDRNNCYVYMV